MTTAIQRVGKNNASQIKMINNIQCEIVNSSPPCRNKSNDSEAKLPMPILCRVVRKTLSRSSRNKIKLPRRVLTSVTDHSY